MELEKTVKLTVDDVESLMRNPEFAAAAKAILERNAYPLQWDKVPTHHPYERHSDNDDWECFEETALPEYGLTYNICADCGTRVWVKVGGQELHLSMRASNYTILTPNIQVKATRSALLIQRAWPIPGASHCQFACD